MSMRVVPAAALAVFILSACGSGAIQPPTSGQASSPASGGGAYDQLAKPDPSVDACKLLTSTDAEAIVGSPVTQGSQSPTSCSYAGPKSELVGTEVITVAIFNAVRKATKATGGAVEAAGGLGDEAFFLPPTDGKEIKLYVRKGSKTFEISDTPSTSSAAYGVRKNALQQAASQALGRL